MSKFVRLTTGLIDKGILISPDDIQKHIKNPEIDHYSSVYFYTDEHFKQFQQTGSIEGIVDVKTDKIWFDFDCKDNLKLAKADTIELVNRLNSFGVQNENLEIFFSGSKGFNIILNLNREVTPKQVKHLALNVFGKGLKTLDAAIYNPSRVLRIPGTKHQSTDYYKTQITAYELQALSREQLFEKASKPSKVIKGELVDLKDDLFDVKEVEQVKNEVLLQKEFDVNSKPRGWKETKWALMQGFFGNGERDTSMMILASTCKALGYDKLTSYYMCKSALSKSWERHGKGNFTKEDLWQKIEIVYGENWKGGSYSETEDGFLQKKSDELGIKELVSSDTVDIKGALTLFKSYAKNIDELTLKTGIEELDNKQRITVGMSWGIIAAAGTGKTSIALQILHAMSKNGELCVFFSYDMYAPHVIQKIIQRHWNPEEDIEVVFEKYKNGDKDYVERVEQLITEEYPNVEFCFESGQSFDDIRSTIRNVEQKRGKKCRFIAIDYNELVINDVSDPTQSSNHTAQKARALAATEQICVLSLFQPNKASGDPSAEIKSYLNAKGGQSIGASVSFMLGVSRPGYNPRDPDNDRYMSLNVVKNRMGAIFYIDLYWDGYKGSIRTLSPTERSRLKQLRDDKAAEKESHASDENW